MRWRQDLVNGQIEINRAVFLMNVHFGGQKEVLQHLSGESLDPSIVVKHINLAIQDLEKAKSGFAESGN
jgi:hypothetical protein